MKIYTFGREDRDKLVDLAASVSQRRSATSNRKPLVCFKQVEVLFEVDHAPWANHEGQVKAQRLLVETRHEMREYGVELVLPKF